MGEFCRPQNGSIGSGGRPVRQGGRGICSICHPYYWFFFPRLVAVPSWQRSADAVYCTVGVREQLPRGHADSGVLRSSAPKKQYSKITWVPPPGHRLGLQRRPTTHRIGKAGPWLSRAVPCPCPCRWPCTPAVRPVAAGLCSRPPHHAQNIDQSGGVGTEPLAPPKSLQTPVWEARIPGPPPLAARQLVQGAPACDVTRPCNLKVLLPKHTSWWVG